MSDGSEHHCLGLRRYLLFFSALVKSCQLTVMHGSKKQMLIILQFQQPRHFRTLLFGQIFGAFAHYNNIGIAGGTAKFTQTARWQGIVFCVWFLIFRNQNAEVRFNLQVLVAVIQDNALQVGKTLQQLLDAFFSIFVNSNLDMGEFGEKL